MLPDVRIYNIAAMNIRVGSKIDKFRIEKKLADGGFARVFRAFDTVEGIRVALKVPHATLVTRENLDQFRKEVRLTALLDHPKIIPIKYAGFLGGVFVVIYPLGLESLEDRLRRRFSHHKAVSWAGQMLDAVSYAHGKRIFHGDIKPDNFILFPDNNLRLGDFGLARTLGRTLSASGSGTVGYMAPEQAMGKPSLRSDVFSLGLIMYRMFAGTLPEWPFEWPLPGQNRLRGKLSKDGIYFLHKALQIDHRRRFRDAVQMKSVFGRIRWNQSERKHRRSGRSRGNRSSTWMEKRFREFQAAYRKELLTRYRCSRCSGPMADSMRNCPWCGQEAAAKRWATRFPARCPRCGRGRKLDWRFCPWCHGAGFKEVAPRKYSDLRYSTRCSNTDCSDRRLMPFMRYCPWCRRKVSRHWKITGSRENCPSCGWAVLRQWWEFCPWCGKRLGNPWADKRSDR